MNANKELQANHKVIRFLEEAKAQSEMVLDALPGVFAVLDKNGVILRGNVKLASYLNVPFESMAGSLFNQLLSETSWKTFNTHLMNSKTYLESGIEFEMDLEDHKKEAFSHLLNIRPISNSDYRSTELDLYVIIGSDITEVKKVTEKMSRMEFELKTAKAVQDTLFPEPTEFTSQKISLAGSYQPASECGGDWWFYNTIGNKIFLWIGDVTGHGVSAALVTSAARAAVSGLEMNELITPASALRILNKAVFDASKGQKYMSFCVVSIDLKDGTCTYSTAAHELPIWIRHIQNGNIEDFEMVSLPAIHDTCLLGQEQETQFFEDTVILKPSDRLFFFTDGVTELANEQQLLWGERKMRQSVLACARETDNAAKFVFKFNQKVTEYRDETELNDDMTFFVFGLINYDSAPPKIKTQQTMTGTIP